MKIPESIRIGGVEYRIGYVSNLRNENQIAYGHISFDDCCIELSATDGTGHEKRCIILWHEILHGIMESSNMELDIETEERVCNVLSRGIYQVLQDNGGRLFDLQEPVRCLVRPERRESAEDSLSVKGRLEKAVSER